MALPRDDDARSESDDELRALARLLGGNARASSPSSSLSPSPSSPAPPAEPTLARPGAPAPAAAPARFALRAVRPPGLFGARFLALDTTTDAEVWLERLEGDDAGHAGFDERLEELAHELAHLPALLTYAGHERDARSRLCVAQPALAGESLRELLARRGTLPPAHAREILRQTLSALVGLHARGRAHGSLEPEHVWLSARVPWSRANPFGVEVTLLGTGLAELLGRPAGAAEDLAQAAQLLGEMLAGVRALDELPPLPERGLARMLARLPRARSASEALVLLQAESGRGPAEWLRTNRLALVALGLAGVLALFVWRTGRALAHERATNASTALAAEELRHGERARAALERFLDLLEEGELAAAAELLAAAQADPALQGRGFGTRFLEAAVATRRALDAEPQADLFARAEQELEARDALASTRARREAFLLAAQPWLSLPGATRAAPRAELLRWVERLEQELARRSDTLERAVGRLAPDEFEPRAALVCARRFPDLAAELAATLQAAEPARAALLELLGQSTALAGVPGELRLWRVLRADGSSAWRTDAFTASAGGELELERRTFDAEGCAGRVEHGTLAWRGTRLVFEGLDEDALELAREVALGPWPTSTAPAPPPELLPPGVTPLAPGSRSILVLGSAPRRAWLAAELGLVRRELPDGTLLELVARALP